MFVNCSGLYPDFSLCCIGYNPIFIIGVPRVNQAGGCLLWGERRQSCALWCPHHLLAWFVERARWSRATLALLSCLSSKVPLWGPQKNLTKLFWGEHGESNWLLLSNGRSSGERRSDIDSIGRFYDVCVICATRLPNANAKIQLFFDICNTLSPNSRHLSRQCDYTTHNPIHLTFYFLATPFQKKGKK